MAKSFKQDYVVWGILLVNTCVLVYMSYATGVHVGKVEASVDCVNLYAYEMCGIARDQATTAFNKCAARLVAMGQYESTTRQKAGLEISASQMVDSVVDKSAANETT